MSSMQYSIDLKNNLIYCEFKGLVLAEDLIKYIVEIRHDPDFHSGLSTIVDIRESTFSEKPMEMYKIAEFVKNSEQERGKFKLAVIADSSNAHYAELYAALSDEGHAKVCSNAEVAKTWIELN